MGLNTFSYGIFFEVVVDDLDQKYLGAELGIQLS